MKTLEDIAQFIFKTKRESLSIIPERSQADQLIDKLMTSLFVQDSSVDEILITNSLVSVKKELCSLIKVYCNSDDQSAELMAETFFSSLIPVYNILLKDASFIEESDPAAYSMDEVIITYPGFYAIAVHRFAHELFKLKIPYLPRLMSEYAHSHTGIDIHPGATIDHPFAIDHGTGVVIGETCNIGKEVRVYQGVTLGALAVEKSHASKKRHPTIGDGAVLYAGCTILGGNTEIGHHSVIGGNVWLTTSVAPYSVVLNTARYRIQNSPVIDDTIDWVI